MRKEGQLAKKSLLEYVLRLHAEEILSTVYFSTNLQIHQSGWALHSNFKQVKFE